MGAANGPHVFLPNAHNSQFCVHREGGLVCNRHREHHFHVGSSLTPAEVITGRSDRVADALNDVDELRSRLIILGASIYTTRILDRIEAALREGER